jgi:formamidopyrimidine-DNA glycosylase
VPELPEVETVRRQLAPLLEGRRLERVRILDGRLTRPEDPDAVAAELEGERVDVVDRRGKYLIVRFEGGLVLLVHLRMTGSLRHARGESASADTHVRAVVTLDDGSVVTYRDVRRFGTWFVTEVEQLEPYLAARLGEEPLDAAFTPSALARRLADRRAPVKAALLDQRTVAGVGNIYADEALWYARLHPLRPAGTLDRPAIHRLRDAVRAALEAGIERQGATLRDYRQPSGDAGAMQHEFRVYGRDGEPCDRCGTPIEKTRVAGRGTWYCPSCQRHGASGYAASSSSSRPSRSRRHSSA